MKISVHSGPSAHDFRDQATTETTPGPSSRRIAHDESFAQGAGCQSPDPTHPTTSCRGAAGAAGAAGATGPGSVGLFTTLDPEGDYGTGLAKFGAAAPRDAARRALRAALAQAGRAGEAPDIVWMSASPGCEESVIDGLQDTVGDQAPILGGGAADDQVAGRWSVGSAQAHTRDDVAVSVLFPSSPVAYAFQSGYAPSGVSGVATAVEGRRVRTIDGQPAADVSARRLRREDWRGP